MCWKHSPLLVQTPRTTMTDIGNMLQSAVVALPMSSYFATWNGIGPSFYLAEHFPSPSMESLYNIITTNRTHNTPHTIKGMKVKFHSAYTWVCFRRGADTHYLVWFGCVCVCIWVCAYALIRKILFCPPYFSSALFVHIIDLPLGFATSTPNFLFWI